MEISNEGIDSGESLLGDFAMDVVRAGLGHAAFSSASSFRAAIPPGPICMEDYLTALPYNNKVQRYQMKGALLTELLNYAVSKQGSDLFGVNSGVRYAISRGSPKAAQALQVARDPQDPAKGYEAVDPARDYLVVTSDYLTTVATGYKDLFGRASLPAGQVDPNTSKPTPDTGKAVNDTIIDYIKKNSPITVKLDGRVTPGR